MNGATRRVDARAQLRAWGITLLAVLAAGGLRMALDPLMGNRAPFATFFIAVVAAVRYGGQWHGLAAALVGLAWGALLWFPKGVFHTETISATLLYFFCALAIIALGTRMHSAEAAAEARARELVDNMHVLSASQEQLRQLTADLSEADRRKDEFLATLAHELRNPLAPIRNGIELLRRTTAKNPAAQSVVGVMERQMGHLVRLVDDLMDVSRITRNKLELRRQTVEVAQVVAAAVEAGRPMIDARGHALEVQLPPLPVHVDADATRLVQVLANLLNNAARYSERGGRIQLRAERQGRELLLCVIDDGNGIPAQMLPRVFDMFAQGDHSPERSQGGLGIGLSMVKRLVELHEGSVSIHSDGPGTGTRVEVRLPLALAPEPQAQRGAEAGGPLPARRILVADDNADAALSLAQVLRLMGNQVLTVGDGLEAVEQAPGFAPDIVMLDLGMPRMDGYEACRRLRGAASGFDAVFIAVTGWGQEEDRARSREAGFDLHLTKPVDLAAIEALLASLPPLRAGPTGG